MTRLLTILFLLYASLGEAQSFTVANELMNTIYVHLPNPISVSAAEYPASSLIVTTNNGTISRNEAEQNYTLIPDKLGTTTITVAVKTGNTSKKIGSLQFRTKYPPAPVIKFHEQWGDSVSIKRLKESIGIMAPLYNFDYMVRYTLDGFRLTVRRAGATLGTLSNKSAKFSEEMVKLIQQVQPGDIIIVDQASVTGEKLIKHDLQPVTVRVVPKGLHDDKQLEEY